MPASELAAAQGEYMLMTVQMMMTETHQPLQAQAGDNGSKTLLQNEELGRSLNIV
jgi:hypothetical protein